MFKRDQLRIQGATLPLSPVVKVEVLPLIYRLLYAYLRASGSLQLLHLTFQQGAYPTLVSVITLMVNENSVASKHCTQGWHTLFCPLPIPHWYHFYTLVQ